MKNFSILEVCGIIGINIPRFCFHKRLTVAGNCRMCLVEIDKSPKPVASCAMPVANNMNIYTNSPLVKKSQESVLEFILLNHPLDCPVCDQGGECDLQEQSLKFGFEKTRFFELKRSVFDKNCGPLIKTVMTRCIHCTRCVRFATEIAGVEILGTTNRGKDTEITNYVNQIFHSEISANVIDICPVGALTSKPYAFNTRPWELVSLNTIDLCDSTGSNIRVDLKESEIIRVLPRESEIINEEWISDKTRFFYDGLKVARLKRGSLVKTSFKKYNFLSWASALELASFFFMNVSKIRNKSCFVIDCFNSLETICSLKTLSRNCGVSTVNNGSSLSIDTDQILNVLFDINQILRSNICVLLGVNPRLESTSINLKLRKRFKKGLFFVVGLGIAHPLTYNSFFWGISGSSLKRLVEGKKILSKKIKVATNILFICGSSLLIRQDSFFIKTFLDYIFNFLPTNGFRLSFLPTTPNFVGSALIGLQNSLINRKKMINYTVGSDLDFNIEQTLLGNTYFGLVKANIVKSYYKTLDFVLSVKNPVEDNGFYVNLYGLKQNNISLLAGPKRSRSCKRIIHFFLESLFLKDAPVKDLIFPAGSFPVVLKKAPKTVRLLKGYYVALINDYYLTNSFCRLSKILTKCSLVYKKKFQNFS
jgi:NADH-quinone oxidoreductase chain G